MQRGPRTPCLRHPRKFQPAVICYVAEMVTVVAVLLGIPRGLRLPGVERSISEHTRGGCMQKWPYMQSVKQARYTLL
jgi:hypothetical protein